MKEFIILIFKGFLIGVGKILPGVSGAMIAISLGIYEKGLEVISNIFIGLKNNLKFVIPVVLGFIIGILSFSKIIVNLLNNCYLPTMLLFIGLIIGSVSKMKKSINLKNKINIVYFLFTLIISILLSFLKQEHDALYSFYILILMGFIEAISMVVPGLSGTALLMTFGYYNQIMFAFSTFNIKILTPFIVGTVLGIFLISKLINYLFKNYREKTNIVIYGLAISSIMIIFLQTLNNSYNILEIIISLVLLIVGYNIAKIMEK